VDTFWTLLTGAPDKVDNFWKPEEEAETTPKLTDQKSDQTMLR